MKASSEQPAIIKPTASSSSSTPDEVGLGGLHNLKVIGVRAGNSAAQTLATGVATSTIAKQVLMSSMLAETRFATSAAMASRAQLQSCAAVVLKLPLRGEAMGQLTSITKQYVAQHPNVIEQLAALSPAEQVLVAGLEGTVVTALVSLAVQQALVSCLWLKSGTSVEQLKKQSIATSASAAGCVGGSVLGATVGTLLIPGLGTSVGSLLGGLIGSQAIAYAVPFPDAMEEEAPWNPSRMLKIVEVGCDSDWLEITDASTVARFAAQYDMIPDASSVLRSQSCSTLRCGDEAVDTSIHSMPIMDGHSQSGGFCSPGDDEVLVFLAMEPQKVTDQQQ